MMEISNSAGRGATFAAMVAAVALVAPIEAAPQSAKAQGMQMPSLQNCADLPSEALRRRCTDNLIARGTSPALQLLGGGWRLSRALNPQSGTIVVNILRTAEPTSDPGIAGLMFRCQSPGIEGLLVMLAPSQPTERITVDLTAANTTLSGQADPVQGGLLLRIPNDATRLLIGQRADTETADLEIKAKQFTQRGSIKLAGISSALQILKANCSN